MDKSQPSVWALSPLDGRYVDKVSLLKKFFSEGAYLCYRIKVEVGWLQHLMKMFGLKVTSEQQQVLSSLTTNPSNNLIERIKIIEAETKHDVKAVEYGLREELGKAGFGHKALTLIHFACTSEDINNLAHALMLKDGLREILLKQSKELLSLLATKVETYKNIPMLARTHGQAASPTTVGKEFAVFAYRLNRIVVRLEELTFTGKMNGTVGNYHAHSFCYPDKDWQRESQTFVESLGLSWNPMTTQIESHDTVVEFSAILNHFSSVCISLCQDMWSYISLGYFSQRAVAKEVGSSIMPHKVNPIDFENAEGNFGLAISLGQYFQNKLPISRQQRDLSDSTVLRNLGSYLGYASLGLHSLLQGLGKVEVDGKKMLLDLQDNWEVLAEPIQSVLRVHGFLDAYEQLKTLTRGHKITKDLLHNFITELDISPVYKMKLKELTPANYIGLAPILAEGCAQEILKK